MKKTKLLTTLGAVALIGAIGVGSTFAYLTSETGVVENTFTIGDVQITLDEKDITMDDGTRTVKGNAYTNLKPAETVDKDPTVHVAVNSVESYVFMTVKGLEYEKGYLKSNYYKTDEIDEKWEHVGKDVDGNELFRYAEKVPAVKEKTKNLEPLFTEVTLDSGITQDDKDDIAAAKIVIKAYAIQTEGLNETTAAAALGLVKQQ